MKRETIDLKWIGGMAFEAGVDGHKIRMDASQEHGGKDQGPRPKPMMMVALAGCTAMDVVSLMEKMRVDFEDLKIIVEGDLTEEHPKRYTRMKLIYEIKGKNADRGKVEKAVSMSQEKYCGVTASYKKSMDIETEIRIVE